VPERCSIRKSGPEIFFNSENFSKKFLENFSEFSGKILLHFSRAQAPGRATMNRDSDIIRLGDDGDWECAE
jgi:hypothetical protein